MTGEMSSSKAHTSNTHFFDLPIELRDYIYEYALEPKCDFRLTKYSQRTPGFALPNMAAWQRDRALAEEHDQYGRLKTLPSIQFQAPDSDTSIYSLMQDFFVEDPYVLTFKVLCPPLLLVSKAVNSEVTQLLAFLAPRHREEIAACIVRHEIPSPSAKFLDICSRSRFIMESASSHTFDIWRHMPRSMLLAMRDVILMGSRDPDFYGEDMPLTSVDHFMWKSYLGNFYRVASVDVIPCLSIEVPTVPGGMEWYTNAAPGILCSFLLNEKIDVLRFLYTDADSDFEKDPNFLENLVTMLHRIPAIFSSQVSLVPRKFDICVEVGPENMEDHRGWADLGVKGVVRITRWDKCPEFVSPHLWDFQFPDDDVLENGISEGVVSEKDVSENDVMEAFF